MKGRENKKKNEIEKKKDRKRKGCKMNVKERGDEKKIKNQNQSSLTFSFTRILQRFYGIKTGM